MKFATLIVTALFSLSAIAAPFTATEEQDLITREEYISSLADLIEREFTPIEIQEIIARNPKGQPAKKPASRPSSPAPKKDSKKPASRPGSPSPKPAPGKDVRIPKLSKIKSQLHVEKDKTIFYSGPGGFQGAARQKGKEKGNLKILEDSWKHKDFIKPYEKAGNARKFWEKSSVALAQKSSGKVHVLLPKGTKPPDFHKGTIWEQHEWKALTRNPKVKQIVMIHPDDPTETVIHEKPDVPKGKKGGKK